MDEEMDDCYELAFTAVEVDLDYEFDAARYFDFTRDESAGEAREAEMWFESAETYPPSPFVLKLVLQEDTMEEMANSSLDKEIGYPGVGQDVSVMETGHGDCEVMNGRTSTKLHSGTLQNYQNQARQLPTGLTFHNPMEKHNSKPAKPSFARTSTLMKPTASQLAKKNHPRNISNLRAQKMLGENSNKSLNHPSGNECQAAKRQKLEGGGLLRKVADSKPPNSLVHKVPRRDVIANEKSGSTKLRITIPREPDLETAQRAQKTRSNNTMEPERATSTIRRFKALPLNRKILETPSFSHPKRSIPRLPEFQEFNLKTSERAMQHSSALSSSSVPCSISGQLGHRPDTDAISEHSNSEFKRPVTAVAQKQDGPEFSHNFKALPLNRKIFSSKGDIGVFRNSKKETTVPMEFNFQTEKRSHFNPPVDLFNKLSLAELQPNSSQLKLPRPSYVSSKGSKENRMGFFRQELETTHSIKENPPRFQEKQPQFENNRKTHEVGPLSGTSRSLGIR